MGSKLAPGKLLVVNRNVGVTMTVIFFLYFDAVMGI